MARPHPQPRTRPRPHARPPIPPIVVGQGVADTFGGALSASMDTLKTLLMDAQPGGGAAPGANPMRCRWMYTATGSQSWTPSEDIVIVGFSSSTPGSAVLSFNPNLTATQIGAATNQREDVLFAQIGSVGCPSYVGIRIPVAAGRSIYMAVSAGVGVTIYYETQAHVG